MVINNTILDVERTVVGILIADDSKIKECDIESKHFQDKFCAKLFDCIIDFYQQKGMVDIVGMTCNYEFVQKNIQAIFEIINSIPTSAHFSYYVDLIKENYKKNQRKLIFEKYNNDKITYEECEDSLKAIEDEFQEKSTSTMKSKKEILELITQKEESLNFNSMQSWQEKINFIENVIYVIGARPSVGKSSLALNIMNDLSEVDNCLFMNMEMKEKEIYQRLVAINSQVPIDEFNKLTGQTLNRVLVGIDKLISKNIKIYNGSKTTKGIRKILKRECSDKGKHTVVFIDHIGYMQVSGKDYLDDKSRIGESMKELQFMTKEFNCTMFIMAQINRSGSDIPKIEYLKDSGQIEEVAHGIILLHDVENDYNNKQPEYDIIIAKNRSGDKGKYHCKFNKGTQTFENLEFKTFGEDDIRT